MVKVRTVSLPSADSGFSLHIATDKAYYAFGAGAAGESASRLLSERGISPVKMRAVFVPSLRTEAVNGLAGIIFGRTEAKVQQIKAHLVNAASKEPPAILPFTAVGPSGLTHFIASMRWFVSRNGVKLDAIEVDPQNMPDQNICYSDDCITVQAVPVHAIHHSQSRRRVSLSPIPVEVELPPSPTPSTSEALDNDSTTSSPRRGSPGVQDDRSKVDGHQDPALVKRFHHYKFDPLSSNLSEVHANAYRHQILDAMFPIKPKEPAKNNTPRQGTPSNLAKLWRHLPPLPTRHHRACPLSYVITGPESRGKFDIQKSDALGVPHDQRKTLVSGAAVTLSDGKVVQPSDVMAPNKPSFKIIIIECPDEAHLRSLIHNPLWRCQSLKDTPDLILYHHVPANVMATSGYSTFRESFGPLAIHHLVHSDFVSDAMSYTGGLRDIDNMNMVVPPTTQQPFRRPTILDAAKHHVIADCTVPSVSDVWCFNTKGKTSTKIEKVSQPASDPSILEPFYDHAKETRKLIEELEPLNVTANGQDIIVTPLGTGSAMPSRARNVSSTHITTKHGGILLDCGEGTLGQIHRAWGLKSEETLRNLKLIFISHMHADHHMGLGTLLAARQRLHPAPSDPLYVQCSWHCRTYIAERSSFQDFGLDKLEDPESDHGIRWLHNELLDWKGNIAPGFHVKSPSRNDWPRHSERLDRLRKILNLKHLAVCTVDHRVRCYGLVLDRNDGVKISFSGDTRPCKEFIEAASGSTLMIHEATFDDDQSAQADLKAHSTVGQAMDVAIQAQAKNVLFTHFSQRFAKAPAQSLRTNAEDGTALPNVAFAWDLMNLRLGDFWKFKYFMQSFIRLFAIRAEEEESIKLANIREMGANESSKRKRKDAFAAAASQKKQKPGA